MSVNHLGYFDETNCVVSGSPSCESSRGRTDNREYDNLSQKAPEDAGEDISKVGMMEHSAFLNILLIPGVLSRYSLLVTIVG